MITVGDMHIHLIDDSDYRADPGGPFGLVPRVLWSRYYTPDDEQLLTMSSNCLLVQTAGKNILVDVGYGHKMSAKQRDILRLSRPYGDLTDGLARQGLSPGDIDLVINTHLHADHVAGNTKYDDAGKVVPVFPNAEYVVQRREYEDASRPNERTRATYHAENFQPLVESGQMRLLDGDTDLAPGVRGVVTPGHTPGHMSVVFESNGQYAVQLCDLATFAVHFERLGWMTAYDVEPLITMETKREWQQWALAHDALLFFPHDPVRRAGKLTHDDAGRTIVQPIEIELA